MSSRQSRRAMTVGAVTIGQSPREDVVSVLRSVMGDSVEILQAGALDDLTFEELQAHPGVTSGPILVTRLRDGREVYLGEHFVASRLQGCVDRLPDQVEPVLLLCTGDFPSLKSPRRILHPGKILRHTARALAPQSMGVLTPAPEQIGAQRERWKDVASHVVVEAASPYARPQEVETAVERMRLAKVDLVVLDCIGYTPETKRAVRARLNCPVLLASSMLGRVAAELLEQGEA